MLGPIPQVETDDRRVFDRFTARFPVKFKDGREDFGQGVFLRDASAQGVRLVSRQKLFLHDDVSLLVSLPDGHNPLNLNGQVMWSKTKSPGVWEVGVKFHKIKLMSIQRLFKFCL